MIFKNTSRLYYCCCLHLPLTCLNGKNIFFFLILRARQQLGVPRSLSLKKLNFARSLCFLFRVANNNKQLLLSNTSLASCQRNVDCMFTARYELDVAVLCIRIRTLTDLLHIFKCGSTCGQI